jgi:hypothetical protein
MWGRAIAIAEDHAFWYGQGLPPYMIQYNNARPIALTQSATPYPSSAQLRAIALGLQDSLNWSPLAGDSQSHDSIGHYNHKAGASR